MSEELKQEQPKKQRFNITQEVIERFLEGEDPMERIVNMTYNYMDDFVRVFYRDENDQKQIMKDPFKPFLWATTNACKRLCGGNKNQLRYLMSQYGIGIKKLSNINNEGVEVKEFLDGYMYMIYAQKKMSYNSFLNFFKKAQNPVYQKKGAKENPELKDQYIVVTPIEQHMIATGKRFFKGYDDYDDLLRMTFDLETTGLDKSKDKIVQLGVRLNRPIPSRPNGFQKIFTVEGDTEEDRRKCLKKVIGTFFKIIQVFQPDIVTGHNIEGFDIPMIEGNCVGLGTTMEEISSKYFNGETAHKEKRETILKLGGEIETFKPTVIPNTIVTDSLHAVRRAQALDSNMQQADLKYVTDYSGFRKENRVYTPGDKIFEIWDDTEHQFAFNDSDGDWYIYDPESPNGVKTREEFANDDEYGKYIQSLKGKQGNNPFKMRTRNTLMDGYVITTGRYIVERYLFDDLYEGDKVEWKFNASAFSICKTLPLHFKKCTTMGTAGQWKALMLAWSYKFGLAIPPFVDTGSFTGGLARLLCTGYVKRVLKEDMLSMYPNILLDFGIYDKNDLLMSTLLFLDYFLSSRKAMKKKMKACEKIVDKYKVAYQNGTLTDAEKEEYLKAVKDRSTFDNLQLVRKIFCNSFYGSLSATKGAMFPWKSQPCGERVTCTGRQILRLLISHFTRIGYKPIVGDSVTGDTPLFIRYKNTGLINIVPISSIMDEAIMEKDAIGREYDYSEKPYQVLCRSGWHDIEYVYRHDTNKAIFRVEKDNTFVDVTQDHSLFDTEQNPIKPLNIKPSTQLEMYKGSIGGTVTQQVTLKEISVVANAIINGRLDVVPMKILNANRQKQKLFTNILKRGGFVPSYEKHSKTLLAGLKYIHF